MSFRFPISAVLALLFAAAPLGATDEKEVSELAKSLSGLKVEGLYYLAYVNGETNTGAAYSNFQVNRGYATFRMRLTPSLDSRLTMDAYQDNTGDLKVRLKYVYALFKFPDQGPITRPNLELGLVHTPWLDFEEHVNFYRMQGPMFMDRLGILSSADLGFTLGGCFGGLLGDDYQKMVNKSYPGRYGSFALGLYNGGGYHAEEKNLNKVIQSRITVRPLPDVAPGMQLSWLGIFGRGNQPDGAPNTDWQTNAMLVSYEHKKFVVDGQYIMGHGNQKGTWADSVDYAGYSVFGEYKPGEHWRLMVRRDSFDPNTDVESEVETRYIAGVGYDFGRRNILLLDWDTVSSRKPGVRDASAVKLSMQVSY